MAAYSTVPASELLNYESKRVRFALNPLKHSLILDIRGGYYLTLNVPNKKENHGQYSLGKTLITLKFLPKSDTEIRLTPPGIGDELDVILLDFSTTSHYIYIYI